MRTKVLVVGGGLAGSEAAWQLAEAGIDVVLAEMRPTRPTPVHGGNLLAELVCSNSLRGDAPTNAVGVLKAEMEALDSLIVRTARQAAVPAGREVVTVPDGPAIIATGPLTSPALHHALNEELGGEALAFFDAVAPIVAADSLDMGRLFRASRYGKGDGADYLNAPLSREAYEG